MDLFAGGHGGLSMSLAALGAKIVLACEIDPEARRVFVRNADLVNRRHVPCGTPC